MGNGQQSLLLLVKPLLRFVTLTLGAMAVATGVVPIVNMVAMGTGKNMATQGLGTTVQNGLDGLLMAGE